MYRDKRRTVWLDWFGIALDASQQANRSQGVEFFILGYNTKAVQTFVMYDLPDSQFILGISKYSLRTNSSVGSKQFEANKMN